jgi:hypothetical protein
MSLQNHKVNHSITKTKLKKIHTLNLKLINKTQTKQKKKSHPHMSHNRKTFELI